MALFYHEYHATRRLFYARIEMYGVLGALPAVYGTNRDRPHEHGTRQDTVGDGSRRRGNRRCSDFCFGKQ